MTLPSNTVARETDVAIETALARLGNSGSSLLNDLVSRLNTALGFPIEVTPNAPATTSLNYSAGEFTLPTGQRLTGLSYGKTLSLTAGVIDFALGTVSTGTLPTFSLPTMTVNFFIKALIQYNADTNELTVVFGAENSLQSGATVPSVSLGYSPLYLVELQSPNGGPGDWNAIGHSNIVRVYPSLGVAGVGTTPTIGTFDVAAPTTIFATPAPIPSSQDRMEVFYNGVLMMRGGSYDYTVTGGSQITFNYSIPANSKIKIKII